MCMHICVHVYYFLNVFDSMHFIILCISGTVNSVFFSFLYIIFGS